MDLGSRRVSGGVFVIAKIRGGCLGAGSVAAAAMDKSMLGDLDALPEEDKMRMAAMIDQLQIRDRLVPHERILNPDAYWSLLV